MHSVKYIHINWRDVSAHLSSISSISWHAITITAPTLPTSISENTFYHKQTNNHFFPNPKNFFIFASKSPPFPFPLSAPPASFFAIAVRCALSPSFC